MKMNTNTLLIVAGAGVGGWFLWQHMQRQARPTAPGTPVFRPMPALPPGTPPVFRPGQPARPGQPLQPPQFGVRLPLPDWAQQPRLQPLPVGPGVPLQLTGTGGDWDNPGDVFPEDPYGSHGAVLQ